MTDGCLPPEVKRLLLEVMADGFTAYCCGPKAAPTALLAVYEWPYCIDLITIRIPRTAVPAYPAGRATSPDDQAAVIRLGRCASETAHHRDGS